MPWLYTLVLEIFAGIKYSISAYFNDIQVIFNIALTNQNHNNQKRVVLISVLFNSAPFYQLTKSISHKIF